VLGFVMWVATVVIAIIAVFAVLWALNRIF
jgi:hypothetical protein